MLEPDALLNVALELAARPVQSGAAELRRAVSTAYYAVFHAVLRTAADIFVGEGRRDAAAYAILYRSFSHARIAEVCTELDKAMMRQRYQMALRRTYVSEAARTFCGLFVELQDFRERCDYDPDYNVDLETAALICASAASAIETLGDVDRGELTDILALMMTVRPRG